MTHCKHLDCKNKVSKIVGFCKSCDKYFCSQHRYPETHSCIKLTEIRSNEKQELIKRLHNSAITQNKIVKI